SVGLARQGHLRPGRQALERFAFLRRRLGLALLLFRQLGDAFRTAGLLKLRQPLGAKLVHRIVLEFLLVSARPDHHRPGYDLARRRSHIDALPRWATWVRSSGFCRCWAGEVAAASLDILASAGSGGTKISLHA